MTESLRRFIEGLDRAKPYLTTEQQTLAPGVKDIADMLWLAAEIAAHTPPAEMETVETAAVEEPLATKSPDSIPQTPEVTSTSPSTVTPPPNTESLGILSTQPPAPPPQSEESPESRETTPPLPQKVDRLKVPAAAALRHPLRLIRALRPLARKVDSRTEKIIDEEATAIAMAEKNPIGVVQQPAQERWLSLELVIEQSRITALWDRTSKEWADLLSGSGLFRSVRVWTLGRSEQPDSEQSISEETCICLASGLPSSPPSRWATPKELLDPSGQSLVMVLSDCVSPRWWQGQIQPVLAEWSSQGPVVVVQWFPPEPYWNRTALKLGYDLKLKALAPGLPNSLLLREYQGLNPEMGLDLLEEEPTKAVILPIVSLEPHQLGQWSRMVAGYSDAQVTGRRFDLIWQGEQWQGPRKPPRNLPASGEERVKLFWQTASVLAQELAGLMSLGPVSPEITNLIQETLLPQSSPVHVAEVFLSGLLEPTAQGSYAFVPEAKDKLQTSMIEADEQLVFQVLSRYVSERYGRTPREFEVFLQKHSDWSEQEWQQVEGFAELRQRLTTPPTPVDFPPHKTTASGTPSSGDDPLSVVTGRISDEPLLPPVGDNPFIAGRISTQVVPQPNASDENPSLVTEEIESFQGHSGGVWSVAFSPARQVIVSGSADHTIRLWDVQGNPIGTPFQGHSDSVRSVAFSPNGQTIVSGSDDKTVRLWDLQGNPIGEPFQGHSSYVRSVAFSPDGQTIASSSDDGTIRLWDLEGNPIGEPFQGHENRVWSVAFSPDGQTIASSSDDGTIRLWDLEGNSIGTPFQGHLDFVRSVAFSPDGQTIVSGSDDHTLRLWDLQGNPIGEPFQGHSDSVWSVEFSPDGRIIVSGSDDGTIRLWNVLGNPVSTPFHGHSGWVLSVAFSPDGQTIASGGADGTIRSWSVPSNLIGAENTSLIPEEIEFSVARLIEEPDDEGRDVEISTPPRPEPPPGTTLTSFNYTVVTLNPNGREKERHGAQTFGFIEVLTGNEDQGLLQRLARGVTGTKPINLEMIEIPGGEFLMGVPETETYSEDSERPQHRVKVPSFYLGRYPVTQAQWRIVASWEQVNQNLNPDPSGFKSDNLPVEQVSWNDAQEFCARLRQRFQREYCLPSEAQWEYACRARTTTPFHFGETLNTDVANYYGNYTYGKGQQGQYRTTTTAVGSLGAANAWGLCDMHGNVWEWCQDDWHGNYEGTPDDGSAWVDKNNSTSVKVRRGGSWYSNPRTCRSASRGNTSRDLRSSSIGFRVACPAPRTLAL